MKPNLQESTLAPESPPRPNLKEIRERYADCSWPNFGYFVHGEARSDIAALLSLIDSLLSELSQARNNALEEAAKVCDDEKDEFRRIVDEGEGAPLKACALSCANVAFALACRIRAMRGNAE